MNKHDDIVSDPVTGVKGDVSWDISQLHPEDTKPQVAREALIELAESIAEDFVQVQDGTDVYDWNSIQLIDLVDARLTDEWKGWLRGMNKKSASEFGSKQYINASLWCLVVCDRLEGFVDPLDQTYVKNYYRPLLIQHLKGERISSPDKVMKNLSTQLHTIRGSLTTAITAHYIPNVEDRAGLLATLNRASRKEHKKLEAIAQRLVDAAVEYLEARG